MKLNLGCNKDIKDGYTNIDIYPYDPRIVVGDCSKLDFIDVDSCDEIYAKDVLEHLPFEDGLNSVKLWCSLLKTGGKIFIQTTNIDAHIKCYRDGVWDVRNLNYMMFAGVSYNKENVSEFDFHKSIYNFESIKNVLSSCNVEIESVRYDNDSDLHMNSYGHNMNMFIWGVKR